MKLALVCPHFPPDHCGVGDHTDRLAGELARQGHDVTVWTAQLAPKHRTEFKVRQVPGPWGIGALRRITRELKAWAPAAVAIQYTPYLFSPRGYGIHPALPFWVRSLRGALKCKVALAAHELHYPTGVTPDRLLIGVPQFAIFQALALAPDHVFFTYHSPLERYRSRFPWKKSSFSWLPAGANILPDTHPARQDIRALLQSSGIPQKHRLLLQFGTSHPTRLFAHVFEALDASRRDHGPDSVSLAFVGMTREKVESELEKAGRMDLKTCVRGLGYLPDWQASLLLKNADLVLAPFLDGVSARRGSVISALAHGACVVTTRGWATDPGIWDDSVELVAENGSAPFAAAVAGLLKDKVRADAVAARGRSLFDREFAWEVTARRMLQALGVTS